MLPKTSPFWLVPSNTAWFLRFLFSSEYSWRVFWFSFFTYQASRSLILTIYSLVWAKDSRKHLCRFLGVFSCRIRCFINPDTSTTLKSDLCFLSQKVRCSVSALLPVSQFENSSRQKSGVTVELTSYIFSQGSHPYSVSFSMPKRSCFLYFVKFHSFLPWKGKYKIFTQ